MAYTAPQGGAVDFSFVEEGYSPPLGHEVDFSFLEARNERLLLHGRWVVEAGATERAELQQAYDVQALGFGSMVLGQKWITASLLNNILLFGNRWQTLGVRQDTGRLGQAYAVEVTNVERSLLGQGYGLVGSFTDRQFMHNRWAVVTQVSDAMMLDHYCRVLGVRPNQLLLGNRWAANGTPTERLFLDGKWSAFGLLSAQFQLDQLWAAGGLRVDGFIFDSAWASELWIVDYLYLDQAWAFKSAVANDVAIVYNDALAVGVTLAADLADTRVAQSVTIDAGLITRVANNLAVRADLTTKDRVSAKVRIDSMLVDDSSLIIQDVPTVSIAGQTFTLSNAEVSFDEGQFAWTCQIELANPAGYSLFVQDMPFTVNLGGDDFEFIVDSGSSNRDSPDRFVENTVSGIGPAAIYAEPRAARITKTWGMVMASAVAEELFGAGVVSWEILDWAIPATKLAADKATPISILQLIAKAAGAIVVSDPDGSLRVRYEYPLAVPYYGTVEPDHVYDDTQHNFSVDEGFSNARIVNRIRITDSDQSGFNDQVEFTQEGFPATKGKLKVFPSPWRTEILLEHTSNSQVSLAFVGIEEESHEETVQIINSKGSLANPVYAIDEVTWLHTNLGSLTYTLDKNEITTNHPTLSYSLVKVKYRTRYLRYDASAPVDFDVQFLVRDASHA